jgi:hypothetical protein
MAKEATRSVSRGIGPLALWSGWGLAVAAWVLHLMSSYSLVEWYCHSGTDFPPGALYWTLNGITLLAAALALTGIILAWRNARRAGPDTSTTAEGPGRSRFMAITGIMISIFFLGIILMQGLPNFVLGPCQ